MAKEKGYFDKLCLDVELEVQLLHRQLPAGGRRPGASSPRPARYSEVLNYAKDGANYVVVADEGKGPVDALIVKADAGVTRSPTSRARRSACSGACPRRSQAMLFKAGLKEGTDYQTVLLDGFDPVAQFQLPIVGRPGYKSNEPGILDARRREVRPVRPGRRGHPGLVRRAVHVEGLPRQAPDGHPGLRAGGDGGPARRHRRPRRRRGRVGAS